MPILLNCTFFSNRKTRRTTIQGSFLVLGMFFLWTQKRVGFFVCIGITLWWHIFIMMWLEHSYDVEWKLFCFLKFAHAKYQGNESTNGNKYRQHGRGFVIFIRVPCFGPTRIPILALRIFYLVCYSFLFRFQL